MDKDLIVSAWFAVSLLIAGLLTLLVLSLFAPQVVTEVDARMEPCLRTTAVPCPRIPVNPSPCAFPPGGTP